MNSIDYIYNKIKDFGFTFSEESNKIEFISSKIRINIVSNPYERTCFAEIGELAGQYYPINNEVAKEVFHIPLIMENNTLENLIINLTKLFSTNKGMEILNGNLSEIEKCIKKQSEKYTLKLINEQLLEKANQEFLNKNYTEFVLLIDKIKPEFLTESIKKKYKIAVKFAR